jgi:hypothetical protein
MLLGYIVSQRGIEPYPEKVTALERMGPIRDLKGVQKVLGCLAAMSCFISRLGEKGLPLYRLLKKHERFSWTAEAQEALDKLKVTLAHAPILTPPQDGEPLYLYVAATTQVVSAVLLVLLVGGVFNGEGVITLIDFMALLGLALALFWHIYESRRGGWVRDKLCNVIMQQTTWVSATTSN